MRLHQLEEHVEPTSTGAHRGVPAGPAREYLQGVIARRGVTHTWIAQCSGVSARTVSHVLRGRREFIHAATAHALLEVDRPAHGAETRQKPTQDAATAAKVRELAAAGHSLERVATAGRMRRHELEACLAGAPTTKRTAAAVDRAWRVLGGPNGSVPRSRRWLAEAVAHYPLDEVATGAGVERTVVRRLHAGLPLTQAEARAICVWMVLRRQEFAAERTAA